MDGVGEVVAEAGIGPDALVRKPAPAIVLALSLLATSCVSASSNGLDTCAAALEEVTSVAPQERQGFVRERCAVVAPPNCQTADFFQCSDWLCAQPEVPAALCEIDHRSTADTGVLIAHHMWRNDGVRVPRNFDELVGELVTRGPEARARAIAQWTQSQGGAVSQDARIRLTVGIAIAMSLDVPILEISAPR